MFGCCMLISCSQISFDAFLMHSLPSPTAANTLTGSLPSEIGMMTSMSHFELCEFFEINNVLTGLHVFCLLNFVD